jgi:hypothetical protein
MITDDFNPYLIEINKHPGFSQFGASDGWAEYIDKFSTNFFHFILSSVIFPYFGLCGLNPPMAEFIGNGTLSPFGNILTGPHRCALIPLNTSTQHEIDIAKKMNFYNRISFDALYHECDHINIYLIRGFSPLTPPTKNGNDVLGEAFSKHPFEKRADPKKVADVFVVWRSRAKNELHLIENRVGLPNGSLTEIFDAFGRDARDSVCIDATRGTPAPLRWNIWKPISAPQ